MVETSGYWTWLSVVGEPRSRIVHHHRVEGFKRDRFLMPFGLLDPSLALSSNRRIFSLQRSPDLDRFAWQRNSSSNFLFFLSFFSRRVFEWDVELLDRRRGGKEEGKFVFISRLSGTILRMDRGRASSPILSGWEILYFFFSRERNRSKLDVKIAIEGTCLYVDVNGEFSWALGNFEIEPALRLQVY